MTDFEERKERRINMQVNVLEWLDRTAAQMPDRLALWDEQEQMNYKEYREKSMGLAKAVLSVLPGNGRRPVVVYLEKSIRVLASFMGIAYSGNFYSPIDVDMPKQRVDKILEVLQPELVITTKEGQKEFEKFDFSGKYILYEEVESLEEAPEVPAIMGIALEKHSGYGSAVCAVHLRFHRDPQGRVHHPQKCH